MKDRIAFFGFIFFSLLLGLVLIGLNSYAAVPVPLHNTIYNYRSEGRLCDLPPTDDLQSPPRMNPFLPVGGQAHVIIRVIPIGYSFSLRLG